MLVDVLRTYNPIAELISAIGHDGMSLLEEHPEKGIYIIGHFSLEHTMKEKQVIWDPQLEFCLDPALYDRYGMLNSFGVCDTIDQWKVIFYKLIADTDRKFVVSFTPIIKAYQPANGGWRWHKWGPYIGVQNRDGSKYLYDETEIEEILVYHVYEIVPEGYTKPERETFESFIERRKKLEKKFRKEYGQTDC